MKRQLAWWIGVIAGVVSIAQGLAAMAPAEPVVAVLYPQGASELERFAAAEVRRYLYLRTGRLLPLRVAETPKPGLAGAIVVARNNRGLAKALAIEPPAQGALTTLGPQQFWLRTFKPNGVPVLLLTGADDVATLHAAYRLAEHFGVRFYLHGDVLPDAKTDLVVPFLDERQMPLFAKRGIQPFHDFPEGPDWWNADDYQAILAQMAKLRMNFLGLHTYPENAPNAEPTVWIGREQDFDSAGLVRFSYPASTMNTLRGNWGYVAKKTGDFVAGGAQLFEHDAFGADVMVGHCPQPEAPEACNVVFNRTGELLRQAFRFAHRLGIETCVGTETPLTIPKRVQERLQAAGRNPTDPAVREELYEGMFRRIAAAYPIDYYWFWTPEGWTWEGTKDDQVQRTLDDLHAAIAAAKKVQAPFRLATCGWVLGPQQDRALFDKILPKDVAISCINREVGRTPVDRGFAEVAGRGKWAIPWMEDDPALTIPQLWVGRMRRDAADARRYGCDGLMGIHWRTRVLGPNVAALSQAAWDQSAWNRVPFAPPAAPPRVAGPVGGACAAFPGNAIADTEEEAVYQTVRYNLSAYHLPLPNGTYAVTLKFCEPHYKQSGQRVFNVTLQGQPAIQRLDICAQAGPNRALDYPFDSVVVTNGWLTIGFEPVVEFPSIAGIVIRGHSIVKKINCGGPACGDYAADWPASGPGAEVFPSVSDFYRDWAEHEFGLDIAGEAAAIFERVDCRLPRPADWVDGPGGIRPDTRTWDEVKPQYEFVSQFEALEPQVRGAGNRARFAYWLETFRYLRSMAQVNCTWGAYDRALAKAQDAGTPSLRRLLLTEQVLGVRRQLVSQVQDVYAHLLATVSTTGELGTVANWDQHLLPGLLTKPGEELAKLLGQALPADAQPSRQYRGPTRVIVPTIRTCFSQGEAVQLKVIVLSPQRPQEGWVRWRPLGRGSFRSVPLRHVARGVYSAELPPGTSRDDFEYYAEVTDYAGAKVRFPATAPALNQTAVILGTK